MTSLVACNGQSPTAFVGGRLCKRLAAGMIGARNQGPRSAMPKKEPDISIRVINWPVYGRTRSYSISRVLLPTKQALTDWARQRFGAGRLNSVGEDQWEYRRDVRGPDGLWGLLTRLLNRSFD